MIRTIVVEYLQSITWKTKIIIDEAELERVEQETEVTRVEIYNRALGFNY